MVSKAVVRYIRITPRKFRQIIPLVKGKKAEEAIAILMNVNKKASQYAIELLKSAVANAKRVQGVDPSNLYISKMIANCGPMLKRYRAASMGRATMIKKRTSHVIVELDEMKPAQPQESAVSGEKGKKKIIKRKTEPKKTEERKRR